MFVLVKQLVDVLLKNGIEVRIHVLRLEIDYELATLSDALKEQDYKQIEKSKEKLEEFRKEMIKLEA